MSREEVNFLHPMIVNEGKKKATLRWPFLEVLEKTLEFINHIQTLPSEAIL
jgi:hypothetical protein